MSLERLSEVWKKSNQLLTENQHYRKLHVVNASSSEVYKNFSLNDYLSLRNDPRVIHAGVENSLKSGAGSGSSRVVMQTDSQLTELEQFFSLQTGFQESLFLSSGFMANISFFEALTPFSWEKESDNPEIFIDHRCHFSLFYGLKNSKLNYSIFKHSDYEHLSFKLKNSKSSCKLIVVESLYSMDGDFSDGQKLLSLCEEFQSGLFIDETHSIGVCGKNGAGWNTLFPGLTKHIVACSFGCGKAVGVGGGFLSTNYHSLKERILQKSGPFIFSTAVPPFVTGAVFKSLEIIFSEEGNTKREQLKNNCEYFFSLVNSVPKAQIPIRLSHIVSVIYGENSIALKKEAELFENGFIVKTIRPPSVPRGTARLRIILRSDHTYKNIDNLVNIMIHQENYKLI